MCGIYFIPEFWWIVSGLQWGVYLILVMEVSEKRSRGKRGY
nr:MAG TPA: hypothetical protein [Ackermannviridae sp.]